MPYVSGLQPNEARVLLDHVTSRLDLLDLRRVEDPLVFLSGTELRCLRNLKALRLEDCLATPESFLYEGKATIAVKQLESLEIIDLEKYGFPTDEVRDNVRLALHPEVKLRRLEVKELLTSCEHTIDFHPANLAGLEELSVPSDFFVRSGLSLTLTPNLVTLTLDGLHPDLPGVFESAEPMSRLRKLSLSVGYPEEDLVQKLARLCPCLEDLTLVIQSQSYKVESGMELLQRLKDKEFIARISPFPCDPVTDIRTEWLCSRTVVISGSVFFVRDMEM